MSETVKCPRCGQVLGETVELEGVTLLHVGGIVTRFVHGVCVRCGEAVHWSIADEALARLLRNYCNRGKDVLL